MTTTRKKGLTVEMLMKIRGVMGAFLTDGIKLHADAIPDEIVSDVLMAIGEAPVTASTFRAACAAANLADYTNPGFLDKDWNSFVEQFQTDWPRQAQVKEAVGYKIGSNRPFRVGDIVWEFCSEKRPVFAAVYNVEDRSVGTTVLSSNGKGYGKGTLTKFNLKSDGDCIKCNITNPVVETICRMICDITAKQHAATGDKTDTEVIDIGGTSFTLKMGHRNLLPNIAYAGFTFMRCQASNRVFVSTDATHQLYDYRFPGKPLVTGFDDTTVVDAYMSTTGFATFLRLLKKADGSIQKPRLIGLDLDITNVAKVAAYGDKDDISNLAAIMEPFATRAERKPRVQRAKELMDVTQFYSVNPIYARASEAPNATDSDEEEEEEAPPPRIASPKPKNGPRSTVASPQTLSSS